MGSDDGMGMSPEGAPRRRGWKGTGLMKHSSHQSLLYSLNSRTKGTSGDSRGSSVAGDDGAGSVKRRPKSSNVIRRAIHKIAKKKKRRASFPSSSKEHVSSAVVTAAATPPKVCAPVPYYETCLFFPAAS